MRTLRKHNDDGDSVVSGYGLCNMKNIATYATTFLKPDGSMGEDQLMYGWYDGGQAFVALNGKRLTLKEAVGLLSRRLGIRVLSCTQREIIVATGNGFYSSYRHTLDGIVRLIFDKHNK